MEIIKKQILKAINLILRIFRAKIVPINYQELNMTSAIKRINKHSFNIDTVIDIGASDGKWSIEILRHFPNAHILAIEPLKERVQALERLQEKYNNFNYEQCIAGETNLGMATLNITNDLDGSTVNGIGGQAREISIKTIDAMVSERNLKGPYLIKFDTHGFEIPILKGCQETLQETNIIILEAYNFHITNDTLLFYEMCQHLEDLGFRPYDIADPLLRIYDQSLWQMDFLFCRKESGIFSYNNYR